MPTNDPMFRRLTAFRSEPFGDFTIDACRAVFAEKFEVVGEESIPESPRSPPFLRKLS